MAANNFEFKQAGNALEELSTALSNLEQTIKNKKTDNNDSGKYQKKFEESEAQLETLKASTKEIVNNIDDIIKKLDKVFEDGKPDSKQDFLGQVKEDPKHRSGAYIEVREHPSIGSDRVTDLKK